MYIPLENLYKTDNELTESGESVAGHPDAHSVGAGRPDDLHRLFVIEPFAEEVRLIKGGRDVEPALLDLCHG